MRRVELRRNTDQPHRSADHGACERLDDAQRRTRQRHRQAPRADGRVGVQPGRLQGRLPVPPLHRARNQVSKRLVTKLVLAVVAALAVAVAAYGFYSSEGAGNASGNVGDQTGPTLTAPASSTGPIS